MPSPPDSFRLWRYLRLFVVFVLLVSASVGGWYWYKSRSESLRAGKLPRVSADRTPEVITVDVVKPSAGGIDRICMQPGTIEPFEAADLYAKISGFLTEQSVDIGSRVKSGQVLARIAVPENEKQVERDVAKVKHAQAVVKQMEARILVAKSDLKAAEAAVIVARTQVKSRASYRKFREKQLNRLKQLNSERTIEAAVVDESQDQYEAAIEAENAAVEMVTTAQEKVNTSKAHIDQSQADLEEAMAEVLVAQAELQRSQVLLEYATIKSPYEGIVTRRSFNRGDFIRSADAGGERVPLFSVERTDKMRVVVQVPDKDVPFTNIGDGATVEIDALADKPIKTVIARVAESEDTATRTMRTEIDLPNPDGKLRRGMYGRVTLLLEVGQPTAMTIPSTALTAKTENSRATVKVVRDKVIHKVPVIIGADNGIRAEVLSGLQANDLIVVRANGATEEGTHVEISGTYPSH
ncbi:MAG: efflux RND transporter periplasmic adaptor subunit [Gemmatales bacterium]